MTLHHGIEMTLVSLFVCVVLLGVFASAELQCGVGEVKDDCPAVCATDYCPKSMGPLTACTKPDACPPAVCKCNFNYRRSDNGTCILTTQCPPFVCSGPNERYDSCPPYCPADDCSQATPDGRCPSSFGLLLVVECSPTCRCIEGYWRKNGVCVPYDEC